jgi:hypothetical protein
MSPRVPDVEHALAQVVQHLGGKLAHGTNLTGEVRVGEFDAKITITLCRHLDRDETQRHREAAMALLAKEGWRDRCACSVRDRSGWLRSGVMKGCSKPVMVALAHRAGWTPKEPGAAWSDVYYTFRCAQHADDYKEAIAVVTLSPHELRALRERRKRETEERYARERLEEAKGPAR